MSTTSIDYDSIAGIYDLYVKADYDVEFFITEAARVDGLVLELAAGTGRLSLPLLQAGVHVVCVDISQAMLDVLSRKLLAHGFQAETLCADICVLQLPAMFDLAILPFQAFMEIVGEQRQRQALAAVHRCLAPGGRFICTLHNPAVRRAHVDGALRLVGQFPAPDGTLVVSGFEQGGHPVVTRLQFFEFFDSEGRLLRKQVLPMAFAFIEKEAFETMARETGFRIVELFGDYSRRPFDAGRSPVMIWVLEKGGA